jgi:hypothetical protein
MPCTDGVCGVRAWSGARGSGQTALGDSGGGFGGLVSGAGVAGPAWEHPDPAVEERVGSVSAQSIGAGISCEMTICRGAEPAE